MLGETWAFFLIAGTEVVLLAVQLYPTRDECSVVLAGGRLQKRRAYLEEFLVDVTEP